MLGFVDDDNFPFNFIGLPESGEKFGFDGFSYDFVQGMNETCDVEVVL